MPVDIDCAACAERITVVEDSILCTGGCESHYHFYCGGFTEKSFRKLAKDTRSRWKCIGCKTRRGTTQVLDVNNPQPICSQKPVDSSEILNPVKQSVQDPSDMGVFMGEIRKLKIFIEDQFSDYSESLNYHEVIVKELTTTIQSLKNEISELKKENASLKSDNNLIKVEIESLKSETLELQQYSRRSNLEISGLPETQGEDTKQLVTSVLNVLNIHNQENIVVAHRVPTAKKDIAKPIIVQFTSKFERDKCIAAAKPKRLLASDVSDRFDSVPVFVNEHLAPGIKRLLYLSKQYKLEQNFKYCWVKDGKIFLRKEDNSRVIRVKKESDLFNLSNQQQNPN